MRPNRIDVRRINRLEPGRTLSLALLMPIPARRRRATSAMITPNSFAGSIAALRGSQETPGVLRSSFKLKIALSASWSPASDIMRFA